MIQELLNFLNNYEGDINIMFPQFERTYELDYEHIPENEFEFLTIVEKAPIEILLGYGFGKWDTINTVIKENQQKPKSNKISIPIINSPQNLQIDIGRGDAPVEIKECDEWILLFPHEWYNIIPDGFDIIELSGERRKFETGKSDDDKRFGCLLYGITRLITKQ